MKCEDVQFQMWSGLNSNELNEHLQTCAACKEEKQAMKGIMDRLSDLDVPTPSRSLKPSAAVIRSTVQRNKRVRWMRSTSVAASITVLLGTAAALGWNQFNGGSAGDSTGNAVVEVPNQASLNPTDKLAENQGAVTVAKGATNPEYSEALKKYLLQNVSQDDVKSIVINGFTPDATAAQGGRVTGLATLDVKLQPGKGSLFTEGTQQGTVQFDKDSNGEYRVSAFELTLVPAKSPAEAVKMYASSMRNREGLHLYALYAPEMRQQLRQSFVEQNWSAGTSSPWIESYDVLSEELQGDSAVIMARLNEATSTGPSGVQMATFTLKREQGMYWYIADLKIEQPEGQALTQTLDLGNSEVIASPNEPVTVDGVEVSLASSVTEADGAEMMHLVGNHAGIMKQKAVQLAVGAATLMTVERDAPAASGGGTSNEYWLAVLRDDPQQKDWKYAMAIVIRGDVQEAAAYEKLQKLAKNWQIK